MPKRYLVKKENFYNRLVFLNRFRGVLALLVAVFLIGLSMYLIPDILELHTNFKIEPPIITQYSLYIIIGLCIILAILGINTLLSPIKESTVNEKLKDYKSGDVIDINIFPSYKFNFFFIILTGATILIFLISAIVPLYNLIDKLDRDTFNDSSRKIYESWNTSQIGRSDFYISHPQEARIESQENSRCFHLIYGLAYLKVLEPGYKEVECLQPELEDYKNIQKPELNVEVKIDGTKYIFKGVYIANKEDENLEFYKNDQWIFGRGYLAEFGGTYKPEKISKYLEDKDMIIKILESSYRKNPE